MSGCLGRWRLSDAGPTEWAHPNFNLHKLADHHDGAMKLSWPIGSDQPYPNFGDEEHESPRCSTHLYSSVADRNDSEALTDAQVPEGSWSLFLVVNFGILRDSSLVMWRPTIGMLSKDYSAIHRR